MVEMQYSTVLFYLATILIAFLIYTLGKKVSNLPPGPWNLPIVGYLPWLDHKAPHISLTKLAEKFGPIYGLYMGNIYTVVVSEINLIKKIQMKDEATGRPPLYLNHIILTDKGVVNAEGKLWKNQRKFLTDYFKNVGISKHSNNRKLVEKEITKQAQEFMEYAQNQRTLDNPTEVLIHNAASISCTIVLGESCPRNDEVWIKVVNDIRTVIALIGFAGPLNFLPWLRFLPVYNKQVQKVKQMMASVITEIRTIAARKKHTSTNNFNLTEAFYEEKLRSDHQDFFTDAQLACIMNDLFIGGMVTTVTTLSWYFLYMAVHQEVQAEVRKELVEILHGETPSTDHWPFLNYLKASLAEVGRIRTAAPLAFPHRALKDINVDGVRIPKDAMIMTLTWAVHMDPKVWGDPEVFRPQRFLDDEGKFYAPEAFFPFHIGKRVCAGEDLANMTLVLFTANVMKNFQIDCDGDMDLEGVTGVSLLPKPQKLTFTKL